jgi:glucose/arabinose dehydrogenase
MRIKSALHFSRKLARLAMFVLVLAFPSGVPAAPPTNFVLEDLITGLDQPMAVRFFPDGRMLVLQKKGLVRIAGVSNAPTASEIYMNFSAPGHPAGIESDQERGLLDIAIDSNFPAEPYIYFLYTPVVGGKLRVARFTHQENSGGISSRGNAQSELILWEDTDGYDSCCHFGGGLDFGPDGKLWFTTGDHFQGSYADSLQHAGGKVHRINKDGTIPLDNPYTDGAGPKVDSTYAYGLRNPFRARWDLPSGRFFIAEVGGNTQSTAWEDLHLLQYDATSGRFVDSDFGTLNDNGFYDGINFGWPTVEGLPPYNDFPGAVFDNPVGAPFFAYKHQNITAAINGGIVYRGTQFPQDLQGAYFYADSTRDFIRYLKFNADGSLAPNPSPSRLDDQNPESTSYAFDLEPVGRVVCLEVGPEGALYYVSFTDSGGAYGEPNPSVLGAVRRYVFDNGNVRPQITEFSVMPPAGPSPLTVDFHIAAFDAENDPMAFILDFGDGNATPPLALPPNVTQIVSHTYTSDGLYEPRLEVADASHTTSQSVSVSVGTPPQITNLTASNSRLGAVPNMFRFGDVITFAAAATDAEDGALSPASFSWSIAFVRPGNTHPAFGPAVGTTSIDFPIPSQGQGFSGPVYYRCFLTVTDSSGLSTSGSFDIYPEKSNITFDTVPSGLVVQVDGNTARPTPFVLDSLINFDHVITVPVNQCLEDAQYSFGGWSNGPLTVQQTYNVPATDSFLTAHYLANGTCSLPVLQGLVLRLESDANVATQSGSTVSAWLDQSGLGNDLAGTGDPQLGQVQTPSGLPAVTLNGTTGKFQRTGTLTGFPSGNGNRTMFVVAKYNSSTWWAGVAYGSGANNQAFGITAKHPTGEMVLQGWGGGSDLVTASPAIGAGWMVQSAVLEDSVAAIFKDGVQVGQWSHTYNTVLSKLVLGQEIANYGYVGMDLAAVLIYNRALTAAERAQVDAYLQNKYFGPPNIVPAVTIVTPEEGATYESGTSITFSASAQDAEQGDLSGIIQWSSDRNGTLGTGASINVSTLSVGTHVITASVTDGGNLVGSATKTIIITGPNTAPAVAITTPADGTTRLVGSVIAFTASATDVENGNLSANIQWSSDLDGVLGVGASISSALTEGTHTITASVADSESLQGTDTITITVIPPGSGGLITSGLVLQLESDLNVALQSGSTVAAWLDQSGLGNDMVASGNPQLAAVQTPSGLPAVTLNGTSGKFERTGPLGGLPSGNADRTMFVVAKYNSSTWWAGVGYGSGANNQAFGLTAKHPTGELVLQGWGGGSDLVTAAPAIGAGWKVQSAVLENSVAAVFMNGLQVGQWTHTYNTVLSKLVIGQEIAGYGNVGMDVAAVLIYNRALTAPEREQVEAYLQNKYFGPPNGTPTVSISSPATGATFEVGSSVVFSGTAQDAEQGNLSAGIQWASDRDGTLGTGESINSSALSVGAHTITASVTDSANAVGAASIAITITGPNTAPVVNVTAPTDGATVSSSSTVSFSATANDLEQGNMASALAWTSSIDGALGSGSSISSSLSAGTHTITATATDSESLEGSDSITVNVLAPGAGGLITAGLVLQLESDLNVTLQSGSTVAAWLDQSGRGNDVLASGAPQLGQVQTPSGLPAITLNGTTGNLQRTGALSGLPAGNANRTMFVVAKYNSSTWWAGVAYGTGANNQAFGLTVKHPSGEMVLQGWGQDIITTAPGIGAGWMVQSAVLENSVAAIFKNRNQVGQWTHTYNTVLSKLVIGQEIANFGYAGMDIAAVLIYDRALTPAERAEVETYLQNKYF